MGTDAASDMQNATVPSKPAGVTRVDCGHVHHREIRSPDCGPSLSS